MKSILKRTLPVIGGLLLVSCSEAQAQTTIRMEAEDMTLDTYKIEALDFASNEALINLKGSGYVGSATAPFPGASGQYDITVVYHDENDGLAQLSVSIDGITVDSWTLDLKSGESQPQVANRLNREIATGYTVSNGDEIRIDGLQGNWDHANVDYLEFVPVGPGGDVHPPIVLDFSEGRVVIENSGYYVLDRDWTLDDDVADKPGLEILADRVTIDLRGFSVEFKGHPGGVLITGDAATLRNGVFFSDGTTAVRVNGNDARIHAMRISTGSYTDAVSLAGANGSLFNSVISSGDGTVAIRATGTDVTIQSNEIRAGYYAISSAQDAEPSSTKILDNMISCGWADCVSVEGTRNVIARNTFTRSPDGSVITVIGDDNQVIDNTMPHLDGGGTAMVFDGTRNVIRGNIVLPTNADDDDTWRVGIAFAQDGNFYGDNLISAQVPFELGGTTQVDLGGNQGL